MTINLSNNRGTLKCRRGTEGCKHDPYGWTEYIVTVPAAAFVAAKTCVYRQGGLGYARFNINGRKIGEVCTLSGSLGSPATDQLQLKHSWESHTGISIDECEQLIWEEEANAEPDPMGPASRYE